MKNNNIFFIAFLLVGLYVQAQEDIVPLDEVEVTDTQLNDFSLGKNNVTLNDSILKTEKASLTEVLNNNSFLYFKENGKGMVSSISFRGTTAQQTAVLWNGININSRLTGQTDFNTINPLNADEINIRYGGGSVIYGTSAIGGSIHLNNKLHFNTHFENTVMGNYGSFNTYRGFYGLDYGTDKVAATLKITRNASDNDYDYVGYNGLKNENGAYYNTSYNAAIGVQLKNNHLLKLYSNAYDGERNFSGTIGSPSRSKYVDQNYRNMIVWSWYKNKFTQNIKAAYLQENYKYFENNQAHIFEKGTVNTFTGIYDAAYSFSSKTKLNALLSVTNDNGEGDGITNAKQTVYAASLLWKAKLSKQISYELGTRIETSEAYESPVLGSLAIAYQPTTWYSVSVTASKNYRMPSFNDRYWSTGGNPNLKAETSVQGTLNNNFHFNHLEFKVSLYHIALQDMIRWVPNASGLWMPENVFEVQNYGVELQGNFQHNINLHQLLVNFSYAYTKSINQETDLQMMYVPFHKANGLITYQYKKLFTSWQMLYNGSVYTSTDHNYKLNAYTLANLRVGYSFGKSDALTLAFSVNNVFNEAYESVRARPMPGRYFDTNLIIKF